MSVAPDLIYIWTLYLVELQCSLPLLLHKLNHRQIRFWTNIQMINIANFRCVLYKISPSLPKIIYVFQTILIFNIFFCLREFLKIGNFSKSKEAVWDALETKKCSRYSFRCFVFYRYFFKQKCIASKNNYSFILHFLVHSCCWFIIIKQNISVSYKVCALLSFGRQVG